MFKIKDLKNFLKELSQDVNFQVDSKKIKKGDIFFALKGQKVDGHNFLEEVAKRGALKAIVNKHYRGKSFNLELIRVDSSLKFLQNLSKAKLQNNSIKIGITGSCGKTTTKEFLYCLLLEKYRVFQSYKNQNSQIGLPLSILNDKSKSEVLILEMGMSEKEEIKKLRSLTSLDIALITNVSLSHSKNFENIEEIAFEKSNIFEKEKFRIINYDLLKYRNIFKGDFLTFSIFKKEADFFLEKKGKKIFLYERGNFFLSLKLDLPSHFLENFLAAFAVCRCLNLKKEEIKKGSFNLKTLKLRFEKKIVKKKNFILDCYNSNYLSLMKALENMPKVKGKKIAVIGEMRELGKFSNKCHSEIGKKANGLIDILICLGKKTIPTIEAFKGEKYFFEDKKKLAFFLKKISSKKDVVLIKGSRILEMEKILDFF